MCFEEMISTTLLPSGEKQTDLTPYLWPYIDDSLPNLNAS